MGKPVLFVSAAIAFALNATATLADPALVSVALGPLIDSIRDLHQNTAYGSLFFDQDAIRDSDVPSLKRYHQVPGDGKLTLPHQQGYCFVFNHFVSAPQTEPVTYYAKITKAFTTEPKDTEQTIKRSFSQTDDVTSLNMPDLCVSTVNRLLSVRIEFSSSDAAFGWEIAFDVK